MKFLKSNWVLIALLALAVAYKMDLLPSLSSNDDEEDSPIEAQETGKPSSGGSSQSFSVGDDVDGGHTKQSFIVPPVVMD